MYLAGARCAHRELARYRRGRHPLAVGLENKPSHRTVTALCPGPDDGDIGERGVRGPPLRPVHPVAVTLANRTGLHRRRVRPVFGLCQCETAHHVAGRQLRQELLALCLGAVRVDRVDDQRTLHTRHRAQPGVTGLQLLHHQPVRAVGGADQPVPLEVGGVKPQVAHLGDAFDRELAGSVALDHLVSHVVCELTSGVPRRTLLLAELPLQLEIVEHTPDTDPAEHSSCPETTRRPVRTEESCPVTTNRTTRNRCSFRLTFLRTVTLGVLPGAGSLLTDRRAVCRR